MAPRTLELAARRALLTRVANLGRSIEAALDRCPASAVAAPDKQIIRAGVRALCSVVVNIVATAAEADTRPVMPTEKKRMH